MHHQKREQVWNGKHKVNRWNIRAFEIFIVCNQQILNFTDSGILISLSCIAFMFVPYLHCYFYANSYKNDEKNQAPTYTDSILVSDI